MSTTIEPRPTFMHVLMQGSFTLDGAKQNFTDIAGALETDRRDKVLIDGRQVTGDPTLVERFYYSEFAANTVRERLSVQRDRGPQFAYVLHEPVLDPHRFGETVALNRGMFIKVFDNLNEAIEWLGLSADEV